VTKIAALCDLSLRAQYVNTLTYLLTYLLTCLLAYYKGCTKRPYVVPFVACRLPGKALKLLVTVVGRVNNTCRTASFQRLLPGRFRYVDTNTDVATIASHGCGYDLQTRTSVTVDTEWTQWTHSGSVDTSVGDCCVRWNSVLTLADPWSVDPFRSCSRR